MINKKLIPLLIAILLFGLKSFIHAQTPPPPVFEIDAILENNNGSPLATAFVNKDEMLHIERIELTNLGGKLIQYFEGRVLVQT